MDDQRPSYDEDVLYVPESWVREVELGRPGSPDGPPVSAWVESPAHTPAHTAPSTDDMWFRTALIFAWAMAIAIGIGAIVLSGFLWTATASAVITGIVIVLATAGSYLLVRRLDLTGHASPRHPVPTSVRQPRR